MASTTELSILLSIFLKLNYRSEPPECGQKPSSSAKTVVSFGGAAEVDGVRLIDPTPMSCLEKICPAVIGDVLVYRNGAHLTSAYVRTLTPWLAERLPEPAVDEHGKTP